MGSTMGYTTTNGEHNNVDMAHRFVVDVERLVSCLDTEYCCNDTEEGDDRHAKPENDGAVS